MVYRPPFVARLHVEQGEVDSGGVPNTPDDVLSVGCPVCHSRPGLQCSISFIPDGQAVDTVPPFELKLWAHEERVRLGRKPTVAAPCVFQ